jgi:Xaa-Pro aminopeptidase
MFEIRIKSLQEELFKQKLESLLLTSVYNISYLTGIRAFSVEEREAIVLVTKHNIYLFTDARYSEIVKNNATFVELIEISYKASFLKTLSQILKKENIQSMGFEEENITYSEACDIEENIDDLELIPTNDTVEKLRETKDEAEIEKIKKACQITDEAFDFILKFLKPELTELEIKIKLENFIRSKGAGLAFESIVAFGKNSAIPHHLSTNYKLKTKDLILLDFGAKFDGYCSDCTRTVFLGKPPTQFEKMYTATKETQQKSLDYLSDFHKGGFQTKKVAIAANKMLKKHGFSDIPHGLGHGVGLQVHEEPRLSPFSEEKLKTNMIVTIEPGVYIPNFGGVRIEDTVLITEKGIEILTKSTKELVILQ